MKRLLSWFLAGVLTLYPVAGFSADTSLPNMTALTTATGDDLLYIVDAPGGTPLDRKITVANLFTSPTFVTPVLGVASATRLLFGNGTVAAPGIALAGAPGSGIYSVDGSELRFSMLGAQQMLLDGSQIYLLRPLLLGNAGAGVFLVDDAANILAQRNGASAQGSRLYNTASGTPGSNYERFKQTWATNVLRLGTENAGTGTARVMIIDYGGTTTPAITIPITSGDLTFGGVLVPTGYKSADGTAGMTGTCTIVGLTSFEVKNGLVTSCS